MRLILCRQRRKSFVIKSCRWSVLASFLLYTVLFGVITFLQIPLKSNDEVNTGSNQREGESIIEYLHKLHKLNVEQGVTDGDADKTQPFYILEEIFHKADSNRDNYLDVEEVSKWINAKTQEHIHESIIENYEVFTAIDVRPKNGMISWQEYHSYFLEKNGFNKTYIMGHSEKHTELTRNMKEAIMRDRAAWSECAKTEPDQLTLDEFLSFRHPESSYSTILSLVDEIYKKFDRDGDEILTEDEFSTLQTDEEVEKSEVINQEENERRKEFREMVDLNKDNRATRREMLTYIDPKNPRHAREEAETLIGLADLDRDGRLSLVEVFNKMDLFLGSKMVDTARSFHDEF